ncbi:MAG: glycoside hydrolase family 92 protein, partial [Verrucomicrobiae bacterium]|nr:glycoside hydrolase family 92 protein [Verrucomicrobiae bacterium]
TSLANARLNLDREADRLDFDQARQAAEDRWNAALGRIEIEGGRPEDRVKFYTGLYHALLGRGLASDVDGSYPRNDGGVGRVALDPDGTPLYHHYNSDSLWGTFWNLNQLWAIAYPDYLSEYLRCHLDLYRDTGWLPDSIAAAKYVSGVGTDFTGVLICGAYQWGIRDYDPEQAFAAVLKNEVGWQNRPVGVGKADLKSFLDHGYVPLLRRVNAAGDSVAGGSQFSASHTLEYSFSSWAAAQFAQALGRTNEVARLLRQSRGWEKLFDAETGFIRPRDTTGAFIPDFNPFEAWRGFQEGNAWQYTFYVPHDPEGLVRLMGPETFNRRLDSVFTRAQETAFGGGKEVNAFAGVESIYNHGNQPSLHISWLFNHSGKPWLSQKWTRAICNEFYGTDGIHGYGYGQDEDQGQLGAWYVMASMGLFDVKGLSDREPKMQLGSPVFDRITIDLNADYASGKTFVIETHNNSPENVYVQSATFNGNPLDEAQLNYSDIVNGGKLVLEMGPAPNQNWGSIGQQ